MEKQEKRAIEILQTFASKDPYQLGYSGGKDSDVILHLAKKRQNRPKRHLMQSGRNGMKKQRKD